MYNYYFIFVLFFTVSKAIICPSWYKDNLCITLIETKEQNNTGEIQEVDYCLQCTYQYRKCEENENFEEFYCNPVNGLCELNETEFENLFIDIEEIYKDSVCINITRINNSNNNKDVKIALICIIVILIIIVIVLFCILMYNYYMLTQNEKYKNNRELENIIYANKTSTESEDMESVSISESDNNFENDDENNIKAIIF